MGWNNCARKRKFTVLISDGIIGFFFDVILPALHGLGNDLAPNRNEYQEYLLGGGGLKADGAYGWQSHNLQMPIVYKFWKPQIPGALKDSTSLL
jgi:hypothetical protein